MLPPWLLRLLERFVSFVITGATGVVLNLGVTWGLTEYVFGRPQYFTAYLFGLAVNLVYNFVRHAFVTFNVEDGLPRRFVLFIAYSLCMAALQAWAVRRVVEAVGRSWYLVVIAGVIGVGSLVTFAVCNWWLFSDR